jgi:uncharacterized membrane protein YhaH (DUF805 family)
MSFFQSIATGFRKYADFAGSASRSEFWWWVLFVVLAGLMVSSIPLPTARFNDGTTLFAPVLTPLWNIAILLPTLAITVRRLRDAGYGWPHVFWPLVPVAGLIVLAVLCAQRGERRVTPTDPSSRPSEAGLPRS